MSRPARKQKLSKQLELARVQPVRLNAAVVPLTVTETCSSSPFVQNESSRATLIPKSKEISLYRGELQQHKLKGPNRVQLKKAIAIT